MPYLFGGLLALVLLLWLAKKFAGANPAQLAQSLRQIAGVGLIGFAAVLTLTGRWAAGIPLFAVGMSILGRQAGFAGPFGMGGSRTQRQAGTASTVKAEWLEMHLDHDSGALHGRFLRGAHAGRSLDDFPPAALLAMAADFDAESRQLLEAYLDRRHPSWREDMDPDAATGRGQGNAGAGPMTQQEAYEILGLEAGADAGAIRRAHRDLMARVHPDRGGSTYLAAKINAAKDLLLSAHRQNS